MSCSLKVYTIHVYNVVVIIMIPIKAWWDLGFSEPILVSGNKLNSRQPDDDLNRSKPVVAIGLSRVVSLILVLI